jgi:hypothetical protein
MLLIALTRVIQMTTKRGIIITVAIFSIIAGSSFAVWIVPQNGVGSSFVVSDYKNELDSIMERHSLIVTQMGSDVKGLTNKVISPDDYIQRAQVSSSQITSLMSELIQTNPPLEWKLSYGNYVESLKKYNDYLIETISFANKLKGGLSPDNLNDEILKMNSLGREWVSFKSRSNETRP